MVIHLYNQRRVGRGSGHIILDLGYAVFCRHDLWKTITVKISKMFRRSSVTSSFSTSFETEGYMGGTIKLVE